MSAVAGSLGDSTSEASLDNNGLVFTRSIHQYSGLCYTNDHKWCSFLRSALSSPSTGPDQTNFETFASSLDSCDAIPWTIVNLGWGKSQSPQAAVPRGLVLFFISWLRVIHVGLRIELGLVAWSRPGPLPTVPSSTRVYHVSHATNASPRCLLKNSRPCHVITPPGGNGLITSSTRHQQSLLIPVTLTRSPVLALPGGQHGLDKFSAANDRSHEDSLTHFRLKCLAQGLVSTPAIGPQIGGFAMDYPHSTVNPVWHSNPL
ncbi:hypothetical protein N7539_006543 [Penicillium diatomitis]|uniref:Uncharacterized protein n=1 Tax=Penicillium diatomitis TaxID=2819901 RepID=A0A9X0BT11_9EURO|nr:uncharacterized protein N7539_006543 [Penicillium diatomitis]KAJ5483097.1 hypothetical protein N7539_006543 [Penicillium diatomitis]